ncbi:polymorphic toxin-type HINT domain-containing protein [Micromonospora auratinigra]|uniref:Intein C-terminal splicing region/RHS repeat-associated core domain-containing protein n=1 Tax=Micromonospora auratinigra TaxID=261654 RepID=A0A1A9A9E8_9ACTN|nr:polymorphic toxin-type HINT domain-containing protein [Micromonospora auratinigra]SBT53106.1 intein C-terminal splicing region/RHS repeat-associated core domain-containing protein [Micromonospora auratinigra]
MRSRLSRPRAILGMLVTTVLVVTMHQQPAVAARPKPYTPPKAAQQPSIRVKKVPAKPAPVDHLRQAAALPAPVWPAAASGDAALTAPTGTPVSFRAPAAGPAARSAAPPARMHVEVLDRAAAARAGVPGLLFRVGRGDGATAVAPVGVAVDYGRFATAYGADWSTRLRLVRLPECALASPQRVECRGTPLPTRNDPAAERVTADVTVGATQLMALTASPSGSSGSYGATKLSSSGTWSAGSSSGNFNWSFPMRVPPALGGPVPTVELGYSSQAVDGRMVASNNQPTEVGEGFELGTGGFIERRYKTCRDDTKNGNNAGTGDKDADDQCWATDNASLSLNGAGGDLIKDATDPNLWHLRHDDGSRIERRTGADNGARNGEWWVVTTVNGTQYWFGRNKLPGWTSGATTASTWTVPVFGNHTGEPCHQTAFSASSCTQAWRWNLDYVVDPHGNTMSYWYTTESNNYQSLGSGKVESYLRSGNLDHVSYGTRVEPDLATGKDTVLTGHAAARVDFGYGDRCLSGCTTHDAAHWPDTPWDLACTSSTTCDARMPSFYTTRRLTTVTTSVYDAPTAKFRDVERWTLTHSYPDPQDGTRAGLWLARISHTGLVGTATSLPDVTFTGKAMPNRVDTVDNSPPMNWMRLTDINSETGAIVHVDYLDTDCVAGQSMPASPENNTKRCYPVRWTPPGFPEKTDYFNRYVVNEVTETDRTGGSTRVLHHYTYFGAPAWHYTDDDGLIPDEAKTWSQWRGYAKVGVTTGDPGGQTYAETTYFRGMNGDHLPSGTRSVSVTDSQGGSVPDEDAYAGMTRESRTFLGPGGAEVSGEIHDPWQSAPTATRTIAGATVEARYVNTEGTHTRVTLDHAPWVRKTYTKSTFDQYGMVVKEDDAGDEAVTGDEQCTVTTFEPRNTSAWLLALPHRVQTYALDCAKAAGTVVEADVIGDGRTLYDGHAYGVAPTKGDVTETDQMTAYNSGSPTYAQVTRTGYDDLGRAVDSWDALDRHSATTYTPLRTGPVTQTVDTNPMGWTTTTTVEPAWGLATTTSDVNQLSTTVRYDGLGRLTKVWLPGRNPATDTPDTAYDYLIRTTGVNAVTTSHLNPKGGVTKSYSLYDGLLRPRQTQTASPSGGRILTDSFYDAAGRKVLDYGAYYDRTGAPGTDLVQPLIQQDVPNQTATVYDGAGRPVTSLFQPKGVERWRTTMIYGGDHTDVVPPVGATAGSTWTDARDRTVQLRRYPTRSATGTDFDHTDFAYNRRGLLDSVTIPDGSKWSYGYDVRGRQTSVTDPDGGRSTKRYDNAGQITGSTDANTVSLTYTYDALGRKTALYKGTSPTSSGQLSQWDYDQATFDDGVTPVKGQLYQASRIDSSRRYVKAVKQYDRRYQPLVSSVTIPSAETGLGGTYVYGSGYNPDGSVSGLSYPASGDLQAESVLYHYTDSDQPLSLTDLYGTRAESSIVSDSRYDALAHATQYTLYTGLFTSLGSRAYLNFETDQTTGRLNEISVHRDGLAPNTVTDMHYSYDDAGNVTKIADTPTGGGFTDIQCFSYDRYQRLQDAWTPTADDCATAPSTGALGGPAPYWQTYRYTAGGARQQLVDHVTPAGQATTDYQFTDSAPSDPTAGQPHVLRGTTTTDGTGTHTAAYTYDKAGNTKTRPGPHGTQSLIWDAEGHLQSVTDTAGTVSYLYDADGNRLVSRDTTGRTLYLPDQELRYSNSSATTTCTRYYQFGGGTVAQRTSSGLTWLASDHQGTQDVTLDEQTQVATIRRQTPFGTPRGPVVTWANTKGFVGGTVESTGLTHVGAREYDPALGRFISLDPVLDHSDPQSMEGYAYGDNDPVVRADPSGQMIIADGCGYCSSTPPPPASATPPPPTTPKPPPHHKHCDWKCKLHHGFTATANWVDDHKAAIAGAAVGVVVGVGCGAAIGWTGVGAVACGALAGAAGNMVTYAIETKVEHKGNFSLGGMLIQGAVGAVVGGVMGGLGSVAGQAIKAGVSSLLSGAGARAAAAAGGAAAKKEAGAIVSGLTRNAFRSSASKASAGAAEGAVTNCHSFDPRTRVLMADGSTKAIKDVRVGDKVLATDPQTGKRVAKLVTVLHRNADRDLADVTVKDAKTGASTVLHTTWHHPFWAADRQQWVEASDLVPGDQLRDAGGRASQLVVSVRTWTGLHWMRDLTVADLHTYYVVAGGTPVLVHNCIGTGVNKSTGLSPEELEGAAIQARDGLATQLQRSVSNRKMPNVAIGGYNMETGEYAAAASSAAGCAETCVINALGGDPAKVMRTTPVLLRKSNFLSPRAVCISCELTWGRENVSPETTFESDWLRINDPD